MPVRPADRGPRPWNKGLLIGQKKPLEPKHVWSIRVPLEIARSRRTLVNGGALHLIRHGPISTRLALKTIAEGTDPKVITEAYRKAHERLNNPPWLYIVHDLKPRAMSPKVKGFVSPQSWFVDLSLISVQ
jgi:hypothetical protein